MIPTAKAEGFFESITVRAPEPLGPSPWPWEALEDLAAQELRLYALGWGDHLPIEVRERIEMLHRRRLELEGQLEARDGR